VSCLKFLKNLKKSGCLKIWVFIKKEPATYKNYIVKKEVKRGRKPEKGERRMEQGNVDWLISRLVN